MKKKEEKQRKSKIFLDNHSEWHNFDHIIDVNMDSITLLELNQRITEVIAYTFDEPVWVVAEISEIRTASNGHCYLELVEKAKRTSAIVARQRATIWNNRWMLLREAFEVATGQSLAPGMKILVCAQVQMHEAYGMSLNILDIDPSFTLGEMALRRKEIIRQLTEEGMIDMNKELEMPILPQRIAVISAAGAAGFGDFCHQIENNEWGAQFYVKLFPATMQGANTEKSIIEALNNIYNNVSCFDVAVIIRGGGGTADLSSFDSYDLAVNVANFPLPVIVGIGHERDNTILDIVAHTSVKTPTAAAAMLIDLLGKQVSRITELQVGINEALGWRMENEKNRMTRAVVAIKSSHIGLREQLGQLSLMKERIKIHTQNIIAEHKNRHNFIGRTIEITRPENILSRGFSITRIDGKAIRSASAVSANAIIETQTADGTIRSVVSERLLNNL